LIGRSIVTKTRGKKQTQKRNTTGTQTTRDEFYTMQNTRGENQQEPRENPKKTAKKKRGNEPKVQK
jgi:hypothetical protein